MVQVANDMLKEWSTVLDRVATNVEAGRPVPEDLFRNLQRVTDQANALLAEAQVTEVAGRRRGLGRGLDALIPTDSPNPTDLEHLRRRLREIAGDVSTEQGNKRKGEP
jgi:hypothetical protein